MPDSSEKWKVSSALFAIRDNCGQEVVVSFFDDSEFDNEEECFNGVADAYYGAYVAGGGIAYAVVIDPEGKRHNMAMRVDGRVVDLLTGKTYGVAVR